MNYWIYKIRKDNPKNDWKLFFEEKKTQFWGSTKWLERYRDFIEIMRPGDIVLCYQSDRNELNGTAQIISITPKGKHKELYLKPLQVIGIKIRPLKDKYSKIKHLDFFKQGPVKAISRVDADEISILFDVIFKETGKNVKNAILRGPLSGSERKRIEQRSNDLVAEEGKLYDEFKMLRTRSVVLRQRKLKATNYTCEYCHFSSEKFGLRKIEFPIVEVHHKNPLAQMDESVHNSIDDLITLCPTCHRAVHAIGRAGRIKVLDLSLLEKQKGSKGNGF